MLRHQQERHPVRESDHENETTIENIVSALERSCSAASTDTELADIRYISNTLAESGITLDMDSPNNKCNIARDTAWAAHPLWLAYATRLDQSRIMFFLPDMYDALVAVTGVDYGYYGARSASGDVVLRIVGVLDGEQPLGPFWDKNLKLPEEGIPPRARRLLDFGRAVPVSVELDISCRASDWYLTVHRNCVRALGRALDVDMEDHDLTKTRIVQVALGYLWHWVGEARDERVLQLAGDAVKAGHLELENHHPEYDGSVDCDKLFTDRVAVHLQKDDPDGAHGWSLDMKFIPEQYRDSWDCFKVQHMHLNLYEIVWDVIKPPNKNTYEH